MRRNHTCSGAYVDMRGYWKQPHAAVCAREQTTFGLHAHDRSVLRPLAATHSRTCRLSQSTTFLAHLQSESSASAAWHI